MAKNLKFAVLLKNAQQDAITSQCGASAILELYSGAPYLPHPLSFLVS